jgi:uncharacterized protein YbjT (DUF2867 family)
VILVVGATGMTGLEVCRLLRAQGKEVRALVRPGSPRKSQLRELGVEMIEGDLGSPSAVEEACRGVRTIISTATAMGTKGRANSLRAVDRAGQLALIEAAKKAGISHFIFISLSPNLRETAPLIRYKREVAAAVRSSGMHWTILQPSAFIEIWLGPFLGWDFAKAKALIFGSGKNPVSWISLHDVARYAVLAVDDPRLLDREIPLGGPEALSSNEVKAIFEEISGRRFSARRAPAGLLNLLSPIVSLLDDRVGSGMSLGAQVSRGDLVGAAAGRNRVYSAWRPRVCAECDRGFEQVRVPYACRTFRFTRRRPK